MFSLTFTISTKCFTKITKCFPLNKKNLFKDIWYKNCQQNNQMVQLFNVKFALNLRCKNK